jgi:dienelactone hydrolase
MKNIPVIVLVVSLLLSASPVAQDARNGIPAHDIRNTVLAGNTHYKMPVIATRDAWLERAAFLRKQILSSAGLLPMPEKRPLNAQVFGKLERDGYTVEKVLLETLPGFYLGGNLYRPRGRQGPFPGVVSPHGHWHYGRLENTALVSVPGRAISFARQGYVVFTYDMVGQNDTNQVPHDWLDARQDLWNIGSSMGIHLWNSIRATDFLTSLPDVDPNRIAATGASGGGTQTFFLMAVDERIKVAAPVNMISATSQGGGCQTAANLRAGWPDFSNMVVGALMAPRPLILISNGGDWTVETPKEVFPAIQSVYRLLGVENNVTNVHFPKFIHNYNKDSREAVYQFFNQHILNNPAPVGEAAFRVDFPHELLALHGRARPVNAITGLDQLVANHIRDARAATGRLQPRDATTLAAAREAFAERLTFSLLALRPKPAELLSEKQALPMGEHLLIGRAGKGDRVPAVWLAPTKLNSEVAPTLIVHPNGIASVSSSALVKTLLSRGGIVMSIDAFQTGSAVAPRDTTARAFTAYNQTNDANRVQDILTALEYLRSRSKAQTVNLVGLEAAGLWSYFARTMAGPGVNLAADLVQFAADTDSEYVNKLFIPGLRKAGDFHAASVMNTQGRALIYNAGPQFPADWARQAAKAAGSELDVRTGSVDGPDLIDWLAQQRESSRSRGNR